jgi:hypothetical protein
LEEVPRAAPALTIRCDCPGCKATTEVANQANAVDDRGWKAEAMSLFSMHLCPEHRRNSWHKAETAQEIAGAPSTPPTRLV